MRPGTPRPRSPPIMEIKLLTPPCEFNHGCCYAPEDPTLCGCPHGPCRDCQRRIDETCPSCRTSDAYFTHQSLGLRTCNGCADKICMNCHHGARYFCACFQQHLLAPSTPVSRQCSTEKWQMAEEYLQTHPELTETIAEKAGDHVYLVRRTDTGEFVRVHKTLAEK